MCGIGILRDGFTYQVSNWICWGCAGRAVKSRFAYLPLTVQSASIKGFARQFLGAGQFGYMLVYVIKCLLPYMVLRSIPHIRETSR